MVPEFLYGTYIQIHHIHLHTYVHTCVMLLTLVKIVLVVALDVSFITCIYYTVYLHLVIPHIHNACTWLHPFRIFTWSWLVTRVMLQLVDNIHVYVFTLYTVMHMYAHTYNLLSLHTTSSLYKSNMNATFVD